jgi:hypothetical protein
VRAIYSLVCTLSLISIAPAQMAKTSMSVRQTGSDVIGPLLKQALQNEFRKSRYADADQAKDGFRHFVELVSLDAGGTKDGESSFVSVVVSSMTPGGDAIPFQWYHKVILVKRTEIPQIATRLMKDLWASWCNEIKSSLSPCPAEEPWPGNPQTPDNRPVRRPSVAPTR